MSAVAPTRPVEVEALKAENLILRRQIAALKALAKETDTKGTP